MYSANRTYIIIACVIVAFIIIILYKYNGFENFTTTKKMSELILYYSPDCGHCHKFMPIWEQFRRRSNDLYITMNKINCKNNKCENVIGFPTIILRKSNGTDITFDGDRTIENLEHFVKKNA